VARAGTPQAGQAAGVGTSRVVAGVGTAPRAAAGAGSTAPEAVVPDTGAGPVVPLLLALSQTSLCMSCFLEDIRRKLGPKMEILKCTHLR